MTIIIAIVRVAILIVIAAILVGFGPELLKNFLNSFIKIVPFGHAGIRTFLGKYDKKQQAGPMLVLPIIHKLEMVSLKIPRRFPFVANVQTKGGDSLTIKGALEGIVDFDLLEIYYFASKNPDYESMVVSSIITLAGNLASPSTLEEFYKKREAWWLALNSHARFSIMPHIKADTKSENALRYYHENKKEIVELLKHEFENQNDHSEIEKRYGLDVATVDVNEVVFAIETQKAINQKKQDEAKERAFEHKIRIATELRDKLGLSGRESIIHAEVTLGQTTENKVYNVSGLEGVININTGGGKDEQ